MSETEEANEKMAQEIEYLRKRVSDLEAEVQDLRFNPIGKEKDDRFRKLVDIMNDGVVVLSSDANITYCNNRLLQLLDRGADEVLGRSAYEFIHEDFLYKFGKEFLNRRQSNRGLYEMDLKTRNGRKTPVLCSASPILDDQGEFIGSLSTVTDLRFLKKAQETVRLERDKFQSLAEVSPFGLVIVSRDGAFEYMNPKFIEIFGYDYEDIPDGQTWRLKAFPDEDYRQEILNAWVEDLKNAKFGSIRARVYTVRCKDGTDKTIHFRPVQLSTGQDLMTCEDITGYAKAEVERKKAYSILESALESTADGILIVDRDSGVSAYNHKYLQLCRMAEEVIVKGRHEDRIKFLLNRVVDPDNFLQRVNYLYEHPEEESFEIIEFADGRIMERYSIPQRIDGEIIGRVWSFRDVTERIELEKDLAEAIEELKIANSETQALLTSARTVLESDNFRHAAQLILNSAQELTSSEAGKISVMDPEGKEQYLLCVEAGGLKCGLDLNQPIHVTGLYQYVYDRKRSVFRNDISKAGNAIALPDGHVPLNNVLLAPLVAGNRTIGFLGLGNKPGGFREVDQKLAEAFAEIAAIGLIKNQMARELEESEERYRMIFAHSPFGIIHYDNEGVIVDCNDKFEQMMGASYRDGATFNMLEKVKDPKMLAALKASLAGEIGHYEGEYLSAHGQKLTPVRTIFSSIRSEDGRFLGGVGIFEDISDIKAAEKTLLQAERVQAVAGLAAGVAHNFNNLLQIIMGNIELSLMDIDAGRLGNLVNSLLQMRDTVRLGAETVKRLQTFAKVRQEDSQEDYKVFDISDVMARAMETSEPFLKGVSGKKAVDITVEQDLEKGLMIRGREDEILEVLINLITNAAEACPNGGEINVRSYSEDANAVISVSDNGIGIAEEDLKRVFDPFWTSRKTNIGTGLGLVLSRSIVQAHGGSTTVSSKPGVGTTFTVTLPLVEELPSGLEHPEQAAIGFAMSVLVIDDMEPIVEMLAEVMTQVGHKVLTATSGADAVEIFKQNKIDVVICDLVMPGMDGWKVGQAIASICAERGEPKTRFILLTGWGGQTMEQELIRKSGVDALLEKPIDIKKLLDTMGKLTVQTTG